MLRHYAGYEPTEIAEILGIPAGTARSRLHHAHRAMRAALEADARAPAIGGQLGMTGKRDIDRILDVWFVDGPSVMPDRLFDAVLDQVGRMPQRPFARLRLRLNDMNPNIRWLTAAAAALVVVLVAVATINRPVDDTVGASSTPLASAGPSQGAGAAPVPDVLRGTWMGEPRTVPDGAPEAGSTLTLDADSSLFATSKFTGSGFQLVSTAEAVDEDTIRLSSVSGNVVCPEGSGTYTWSLSSSGETLEVLAEDADTCAVRGAATVGTYWRADCPADDNDCLGTLDAGTYASQFFDPFVANSGAWFRRYGALTYTVPADWVNAGDWPGFYSLAPVGASDGTMIFLASDVVVAITDKDCEEVQDPDIGTTATAITDWLAAADGLISSTPEEVSIGGLDGLRVDITMDPEWTETCPYSDGEPTRTLFVDRTTTPGFSWNIGPGGVMRLYFLDLGDGRALMIDIESISTAEYDAIVDEATTIVESFVFTP